MKTKAALQKKTQQPVGIAKKDTQKQPDTIKNEKKPNVRTTDYKKIEEIILTDPDSLTREEFLFFQSAVGYRRAIQLLNEGKRRKQLRKMDGTGKTVRNLQQNIEQDTTGTKEQKVIQKQKLSQVSQKSDNGPIQKKVSANITSSSTSLPNNLRSGLENLSGTDLSDVSVHKNSDKPQQVGALAYTQGKDIHIAPGQEKHLPHEGWHAVQQKQGRVAPTLQMKSGALVNDDTGLEKEADVMGDKATQIGSQNNTNQLKKLSKISADKGDVKQKKNYETTSEVIRKITKGIKKKKAKGTEGSGNTPPQPKVDGKVIGSQEYIDMIEKLMSDATRKYFFIQAEKLVMMTAGLGLEKIMSDVKNNSSQLDNISEDNLIRLCKNVNILMLQYGTVNKKTHYFRNYLNRAPKTLKEMIKLNKNLPSDKKWRLLAPQKAIYHMYGKDGEYNLKFVSADGFFEAVYNKSGKLLTQSNDGVNMGTYNYADPETNVLQHANLDVLPYYSYGNVTGVPKPSKLGAYANLDRYKANIDAQNHYNAVYNQVK